MLWPDSRSSLLKTTVIPDVDVPSFEALEFEFARDKQCVYAVMKPIAGADPVTFEVLDWRHSRDATTLYRDEVEVVGVTPRTFSIWGDYRREGQYCFYGDDTILEADAESFHGVGGSYAVDNQRAYFCGRVLSSANPATLTGLGVDVARDAKRTFLGDTEFEGVLLDSWLSESAVRIHMRLASQQGSGVSAMVLARQLLRDEEPVEALHWAFLAVHWTRGKDRTKAKRLLRSAHRATDPDEEVPEIQQEVCLGIVRMLLAGVEIPADSQLAHVFLELANSVQGCSPLNMTALQDEFGIV